MRTALLIMTLLYYVSGHGQTPPNDQHWQLKWSDDFTTSSIDPGKWILGDNCDHYGNKALFLAQNVFIDPSNHSLVIKVDNNSVTCQPPAQVNTACGSCAGGVYNYTSGWVESKSNINMEFGYVEARVKIPYGKGLSPAFWTFYGDGVLNRSNAAEIDIFEILDWESMLSDNDLKDLPPQEINSTTMFLEYCKDPPYPPLCPQPNYTSPFTTTPYTNWHTYGMEWSPSRIIWYLDGNPVRLLCNHGIVDPVRLIFDIGILTDPDSNNCLVNETTTFPSYMFIDYVNCYELKKDCEDFINSTNYNFSAYNNREKNFIKIGNGNGINALSVGDSITMRASQYIDITGDFYVPIGASLYLDANKECGSDIDEICTQTFNPCVYNFSNYDNSVKKAIELGGNGCDFSIVPVSNNLLFQVTDQILLKPNVTISSIPGKSVDLVYSSCH